MVSIPQDKLLSTHMVLANPYIHHVVANSFQNPVDGSTLSAMQVLAFGLLYFKFNPSVSPFWTQYIETMPSTYDSLIFWSDDTLDLLGAPELKARVAKRTSKISALHAHGLATFRQYSVDRLPEESKWLAEITEIEFRWAYASVMSRSVFVKNSSREFQLQKDNAALPPFLDFFNHSDETECEAGFNTTTHCYELRTKQKWKADSQVFIKYGAHSNATLLMHYGFAIKGNAYDAIRLDFDFEQLISATKFATEKLTKLHEMNLISPAALPPGSKRIKHELTRDGLGWNTLVAIKTMLIETEEELKNWDRLLQDEPISPANEAEYLRYCIDLYTSMINSTEAAGHLEASESVPDFHVEMAALFRINRIRILQSALEDVLVAQYAESAERTRGR